MTTITTDERRGSGEIALWWVGVIVACVVLSVVGVAVALVGAFTRLRAHRVQRVALPLVAVLIVGLMIAGMVFTVTTFEVTDVGAVPSGADAG
ncbi:hypothetical protein [Aeromicrobium massiliense]|uniref:hypothetical protein n=1 Tax=Aeromicrobium massiliense TaxID=1464554 RepID=UPI000301CC39|nr:hypothetical protein [Aeromicrobium massiliense]